MREYNLAFAIMITVVNLATILILVSNIMKNYRDVMRNILSKAKIDFHYGMIFISTALLVANAIIIYIRISTWLTDPSTIVSEFLAYWFAYHVLLLFISGILVFLRKGYNPFREIV